MNVYLLSVIVNDFEAVLCRSGPFYPSLLQPVSGYFPKLNYQTSRNTLVRQACPINFDQVQQFFIPDRSDCPAFIQAACIQNVVAKGAKPRKNRKSTSEECAEQQ
jgi:hypothetical protein